MFESELVTRAEAARAHPSSILKQLASARAHAVGSPDIGAILARESIPVISVHLLYLLHAVVT